MKKRLYMKPARPPKWWPRDANGKPRWAGVFKDGVGWVAGDGDLMTAQQIKIALKMIEFEGKVHFEVR